LHGYTHDKARYLKRLRRIEGQVRGLQRMIDEDKYCIDVLTQVSAVTRALESVALGLLEEHLGHCVAQAVDGDGENTTEKVREASAAIARLVRSLPRGSHRLPRGPHRIPASNTSMRKAP
jgi:DNA-binding FrmR family transcriptional regulator